MGTCDRFLQSAVRIIALASVVLVCGCRSTARQTSTSVPERSQKIVNDTGIEPRLDDEIQTAEAFFQSDEAQRQSAGDNATLVGGTLALTSQKTETPAAPSRRIDLQLQNAVALGLNFNPDLVALRATEPVAHATFHVADTYPFNPQFQTQVLPYVRDRNGQDLLSAQQYVIVQTFELRGQQRYRTEGALADWSKVREDIRQAERLNVAQTERFFFAALYQQQLLDFAEYTAKINEDIVGVLERRFQAGQSSGADVELARLDAESARQQAHLAQANYTAALLDLRAHLNLDMTQSIEPADDWLNWHWRSVEDVVRGSRNSQSEMAGKLEEGVNDKPKVDSLPNGSSQIDDGILQQLIADRPDVMSARAAVVAARANLDLADAARCPDLQIGPMYQRDETATNFWGFQAQIDIPVVNSGTPLVRQRMAECRQRQISLDQLQAKALTETRSAIQRYEQARRLAEMAQGKLSRTTSDVLPSIERQFEAGEIDLLRVFAARTSLMQSRRNQLDLINQLTKAAADVTMATGLMPDQLIEYSTAPPAPSAE